MRDILFRGKTTSGRWIEGNYVKLTEDGREYHYIMPINDDPELIAVRPETIGQYTGVVGELDEQPVYEGDIVEFIIWGIESMQCRGSVVYQSGGFAIRDDENLNEPAKLGLCVVFEVIGNIHDKTKE